MHLFHYHLVTSRVREVEARYLGKLAFELVARYGRIGDEATAFESGTSWEELDSRGFRLRLSELERGAVNVVVQPGQWEHPRVDHLGLALDEGEFDEVLERAEELELRVQEHGGRRTFVATGAGYRLELHPPREWLEELLENADDPARKADVLADLLGIRAIGGDVEVGDALVRFMPGGAQGRPELLAELFR
ncbi:MAG: hypothetical protein WD689_08810 [Gaiellaceae bacterium]